jgi:sortase A
VLTAPDETDAPVADDGDVLDTEEVERAPFVRRHAGALLAVLSSIVTLGSVVAFFVIFAFGLSAIQEHRNQQQLYSSLRGLLSPSSTVAPWIGGAIPTGAPLALLSAPAGGLHDVVVVQGSTSSEMRDGPGHLPDSPLPGQVGDSILIGRSSTTGAPFGGLANLRRGDKITITTGQGTFTFHVEDLRRAGSALPKIPPSGSLVTFVTSTGSGALGSIVNGHLLYVDAALAGEAVATPHGQPRSIAEANVQGQGDAAALPFVLAWLGALIASLVAAVWLISRWGWRRAWLFIVPVMLAVLWGLSNELLRLVPNVY